MGFGFALGARTTAHVRAEHHRRYCGVVYDPAQAVVAKAAVHARNITTAAKHSTETDQNGYYRWRTSRRGTTRWRSRRRASAQPCYRPNGSASVTASGSTSRSRSVRSQNPFRYHRAASGINTEDAQLGKVVREIPQLPVLSGNGGRNALNLRLPSQASRRTVAWAEFFR